MLSVRLVEIGHGNPLDYSLSQINSEKVYDFFFEIMQRNYYRVICNRFPIKIF